MLVIKAMLVLLRVARLPPLVQCVLVTIVAFQVPPELGCLTAERCDSSQVVPSLQPPPEAKEP